MMTNFKIAIQNTWDSFVGRIALCFVCFGWLPFYLLTLVQQSLTK